jgi:hypothetical protein
MVVRLLTSCICKCRYVKTSKKIPGKGGLRFYRNVGLGFKTPKEAIEGGLPVFSLYIRCYAPNGMSSGRVVTDQYMCPT